VRIQKFAVSTNFDLLFDSDFDIAHCHYIFGSIVMYQCFLSTFAKQVANSPNRVLKR